MTPIKETESLIEDENTGLEPSPQPLRFTATGETGGMRLDSFLAAQIAEHSRSQLRRAIEMGNVTVNRQVIEKPAHEVHDGDRIEIIPPVAPPLEAKPEKIPLNIVYEDDQIIVINKPAGMVTHPGAGINSGTLANALVYHLNLIDQKLPRRGGSSRPGIVHRLDAGTSGLIVAAKTDTAHLSLAAQFSSRTVLKNYLALVYGRMVNREGKIQAPIGRDPKNRVKMAVRPEGDGREAITLYREARGFDQFTLLDVEIKTGRTHQIRVHLAYINHPVVGDSKYDEGRSNSIKDSLLRSAINKLGRPFLHASRLSFIHPSSGRRIEFSAPLPNELESLLQMLE